MNENIKLKQYYDELFPFKQIWDMLCSTNGMSCGNIDIKPENREFSITLEKNIMQRYISFSNPLEMKLLFINKIPKRIEVGSVYAFKPNKLLFNNLSKTSHNNLIMERTLVFDVDIEDYDEGIYVRDCKCSNIKSPSDDDKTYLCTECFPILEAAKDILNYVLRNVYGFEILLFVFSGRRGIHCWVGDIRANILPNMIRTSIILYINKMRDKKDFNFMTTQEQEIYILMKKKYINGDLKYLKKMHPNMTDRQICFKCLIPRLDENVTTSPRHLIKMPFCVHPATEKICIPMGNGGLQDKKININYIPTLSNVFDCIYWKKYIGEITSYANLCKNQKSSLNMRNEAKELYDI